ALAVYVAVGGLLLVSLASLGSPGAGGGGAIFGERIALVELEGLIVDVEELVRELRGHRDNPAVRAVVIRINSPGGVVAPTQELQFADGRIVSGGQAKALGMVDALGGLEEAIDGAAALAGLPKPPRVVGPRRKFSVFDLLRSELGVGGLGVFRPSLPLFSTPLYLLDWGSRL